MFLMLPAENVAQKNDFASQAGLKFNRVEVIQRRDAENQKRKERPGTIFVCYGARVS